MKIEITPDEIRAIKNASTWLRLLIERDDDSDDDRHAGMVADKAALDRIAAKARPNTPNTQASNP
ncbi:hypothetical protein Ga0100231_023975 [Opitutaceae bacterium TAV4]|nr:hypothetical protein Ga0100231_023975 [Opitutaceae bacterium TAV4]RRK00770.1 hypothetical protein Ga0100230_023550 [Opitutaceae bacterium TAV3]